MCYIVKKKGKGTAQEKKRAAKRGSLRERTQPRKRVVCGEENKRREQSIVVFEKYN